MATPSARERVLDGATQVLHAYGFHAASMAAIGTAAGVTGPALYRHFAGKNQLLAAVVEAGAQLVEDALDRIDLENTDAAAKVAATADALAVLAAEHRFHGAIIQRDTRSLQPEERARARDRWHLLVSRLSAHLLEIDTRLHPGDAELLSRAAFAVAASASYSRHSRALTARERELLRGTITTVLRGDWLVPSEATHPPARPVEALRDRSSRREAIMSVATRLFGERGFHNVSMENVAEVAGVTVPTVYSHFTDKATLMSTAQDRANSWLWLAITRAVEQHDDAEGRLREILGSYCRFGVDHPDHMSVLVHEVQYLPAEYQPTALQGQKEYVAEIVRPLQSCRPELDDPARRVLVHAALGVVNEVTRTTRYLGRPHLHQELATLTAEICLG